MKDALRNYIDAEISVYTHGSDCYSEGILREVTDSVLVLETKGRGSVREIIIPICQIVKIAAEKNQNTKI